MTNLAPHERIFCAVDTPDAAAAIALGAQVGGAVGGLKLGLEFFCAAGPDGVRSVMAAAGNDMPLFLDLKLNDIPNTVAGAVRSAVSLNPTFLTLHANGGAAMMAAAVKAAHAAGSSTKLLAVTVLTSLDDDDLSAVGQQGPVLDQVLRLASLAQESGMHGVVCSPAEVAAVRHECGPDLVLMVPGIRPVWAAGNDQKRVLTPLEAIELGADYLVIGRPITADPSPAAAAARIVGELAGAVRLVRSMPCPSR